jgi:hypothetical protein
VLGPEQVNFTLRPTPIFLEGVIAVKISEQMAREFGLRDNQVVRGILQDRSGILKLILNNREFDWAGGKRFKAGDNINFRVESSVYGRSLKAISATAAPAVTVSPMSSPGTLSSRILSLLYRPDQGSAITQLLVPGGRESLFSMMATADRGQSLFINNMGQVSPDAVKNALMNSGLFGEYFLAAGISTLPDMKQLLRLLLRSAPMQSTLAGDINRAVDEIEGRQLETLQAQQGREVSYSFVLPFADSNPVEIQFERGAYNLEEGEADWVINIHTRSDSLGELWLKTTLKSGSNMKSLSRLEMILWAERASIAALARAASGELESELESFGLVLTKLTILNASRPMLDAGLSGPGQVVDVST